LLVLASTLLVVESNPTDYDQLLDDMVREVSDTHNIPKETIYDELKKELRTNDAAEILKPINSDETPGDAADPKNGDAAADVSKLGEDEAEDEQSLEASVNEEDDETDELTAHNDDEDTTNYAVKKDPGFFRIFKRVARKVMKFTRKSGCLSQLAEMAVVAGDEEEHQKQKREAKLALIKERDEGKVDEDKTAAIAEDIAALEDTEVDDAKSDMMSDAHPWGRKRKSSKGRRRRSGSSKGRRRRRSSGGKACKLVNGAYEIVGK